VFELLQQGKLPRAGFVGQEQVPLEAFLSTRVGHYYQGLGVSASSPSQQELAEA